VHPGPLENALSDAQTLHRSLFLYIYCKENPSTQTVNLVLDSMAHEIERGFVFLALDIAHPEGWSVAHTLKFQATPVIALVRPRGTSLAQSIVFVKHDGLIGEAALLSYVTIELSRDGTLILAQDAEFERAVAEAETNQRRTEELAADTEIEEDALFDARRAIEREYLSIPLPTEKAETVTIRFQFPDNTSLVRRFFQGGPVRWLFIFVRKFVFPKQFVLLTGFPLAAIPEDDSVIGALWRDRSFIVTVEYADE
jgi:hypothetical protein